MVPAPDQTLAHVPDGQIDDTPSSLAQAGVNGGVTLEQADSVRSPVQKPIHELLALRTKKGERYVIHGEIARGGIGTVLRGIDCDIRREVAVKYMLDQSNPAKKLRFLEAEVHLPGNERPGQSAQSRNQPPTHRRKDGDIVYSGIQEEIRCGGA